ncbi:unnamed protein product [Tetraodon nigroviridis]|uniref:(spotted green pufferfish) hypothetical protein n=1 Tax=Tetraodon nigroviridis TaxID=99883 RepID=Q4RX20_TETNG|nr:unnamed protein product [Tetraodon nigroviridis]
MIPNSWIQLQYFCANHLAGISPGKSNPALVEARGLPPEGLLQSGRCVTGPLHSQLC